MAPLEVRLAGGGLKREPSVALAFILRFCTIPFGTFAAGEGAMGRY